METELRQRWEDGKWGICQIGIYMTDDERTFYYEKEAAEYCIKNGECSTCSLVNYGLDCHNNRL